MGVGILRKTKVKPEAEKKDIRILFQKGDFADLVGPDFVTRYRNVTLWGFSPDGFLQFSLAGSARVEVLRPNLGLTIKKPLNKKGRI